MAEPTREFEHGYTCVEVVELATTYVEGAMPPADRTLFEMHLNFCDGCDTFVDQIRVAADTASRVPVDHLPEETKAKLLAAFRDWRIP